MQNVMKCTLGAPKNLSIYGEQGGIVGNEMYTRGPRKSVDL